MKRIVQVYGFHWVLLGLFVIVGVTAGFVVFPAIVTKVIWNFCAAAIKIVPKINIFAAILLWAIIATTLYVTTKDKFAISYNRGNKISKDEFVNIIREARRNGISLKMLKSRMPKRKR